MAVTRPDAKSAAQARPVEAAAHVESAFGRRSDREASRKGLPEDQVSSVQTIDSKFASRANLDAQVTRNKLELIGRRIAEVQHHEFVNWPVCVEVMSS